MFKNQRILIIGGAGFVGSNLCHRLLKENPEALYIVDNLISAELVNVPKHPIVTFHYGSISDDRIILKLPTDFDYIFHLATYHGNQSSIEDPIADHQNNTLPTLKICEYFKNAKRLKKIVYASAGCTVANKTFEQPEATKEEAPVSLYLDSPYQISKIVGEFYGNYYFMRYDLPFVKARFQNVYGPREILGAGQWRGNSATIWRNVIPTFIWRALNNEPLLIDKGGLTTRDFIYVDDIVEGLISCAINGNPNGVYNLASGEETSIADLAKHICSITNSSSSIVIAPERNWDRSGRRLGDPTKSKSEIKFSYTVDLIEGLSQTISWTKTHYSTILNCIKKHEYYSPEVASYSN